MNTNELFSDDFISNAALIEAYSDEYARHESDWKSIETKAQGTIAVAGILTGFALNYVRDVPSSASLMMQVLIVAVVFLLLVSIVFAASALYVRRYRGAVDGAFYDTLVRAYRGLSVHDDKKAYKLALQQNQLSEWKLAIADRKSKNDTKAKCVEIAQCCLFVAIVLTTILAAWTVLKTTPPMS